MLKKNIHNKILISFFSIKQAGFMEFFFYKKESTSYFPFFIFYRQKAVDKVDDNFKTELISYLIPNAENTEFFVLVQHKLFIVDSEIATDKTRLTSNHNN